MLRIDDAHTMSTSARRVFITPPLPAGRLFHYDLRAEVLREGRRLVINRTVSVEAGRQTVVNLTPNEEMVAER